MKPNYASMAKGSGLEKQVLQTSIQNLFQLIGEVLGEGNNVEVDLGNFGKIQSINKNVTYAPLSKSKPGALHGKQTVKTLMDISTGKEIKGSQQRLEPLDHVSKHKLGASQ